MSEVVYYAKVLVALFVLVNPLSIMGIIITAIAVEMMSNGVSTLFGVHLSGIPH